MASDAEVIPPPSLPPGALSAEEFVQVLRRKDEGNRLFKSAELLSAIKAWDAALEVYGMRPGDALQRAEKAKISSNKAQVYITLERYEEARDACTVALKLDKDNQKARFRRARSCLALGGHDDLLVASEDVQQIQKDGGSLGAAEAALLKTATGKSLLPSLAARGLNGSSSKPPAAGELGEAGGDEEDARRRAAAAVAAVAPHLAQANEMAAAAATAAKPTPTSTDGGGGGAAAAVDIREPPAAAAQAVAAVDAEDDEEAALLARRRAKRLEQLKAQGSSSSNGKASPSREHHADNSSASQQAWMRHVSNQAERYPWLIDVYRTRVEAEAKAEARAEALAKEASGLMSAALAKPTGSLAQVKGGPRASRLSRISNFLVFSKLAVACGAVGDSSGDCEHGPRWEWPTWLRHAAGMLDKGFNPEQCGAHHRYGHAAAGDEMRRVGAQLYDARPELVAELRQRIADACWGEDDYDDEGYEVHRFSFERGDAMGVFDDVGGVEAWMAMNDVLKKGRLG